MAVTYSTSFTHVQNLNFAKTLVNNDQHSPQQLLMLVILDHFFLNILNFVYVKKVCQKSRPFSKCIRPQNSLLLSGVVTFPDFSKIEGQRLCL